MNFLGRVPGRSRQEAQRNIGSWSFVKFGFNSEEKKKKSIHGLTKQFASDTGQPAQPQEQGTPAPARHKVSSGD